MGPNLETELIKVRHIARLETLLLELTKFHLETNTSKREWPPQYLSHVMPNLGRKEASGKERQGKARHMLRNTYQLAPKRPLRSLKHMLCVGLSAPGFPPSALPSSLLFSSLLSSFLTQTPSRRASDLVISLSYTLPGSPILVPSPFLLGCLLPLACLIA